MANHQGGAEGDIKQKVKVVSANKFQKNTVYSYCKETMLRGVPNRFHFYKIKIGKSIYSVDFVVFSLRSFRIVT